jgi:hypothetical protein
VLFRGVGAGDELGVRSLILILDALFITFSGVSSEEEEE